MLFSYSVILKSLLIQTPFEVICITKFLKSLFLRIAELTDLLQTFIKVRGGGIILTPLLSFLLPFLQGFFLQALDL